MTVAHQLGCDAGAGTILNGIGSEMYNYRYPPTAHSLETQCVLDFRKCHSLLCHK